MDKQRCDLCGREGTRGFRLLPAGSVNTKDGPVSWPEIAECTGKVACQRRAFRSIPVEVRARNRWQEW